MRFRLVTAATFKKSCQELQKNLCVIYRRGTETIFTRTDGKGHQRLTDHTWKTVTNYLKEDCPLNNGHYDHRMPVKLAPYERIVIDMRSKGITYSKIHAYITQKRYDRTVASLRVFLQKERTHQQRMAKQGAEPAEYIPRKFMGQLIYRKLEDIKVLTQGQYEAALKNGINYEYNIGFAEGSVIKNNEKDHVWKK